MDDIANFYISFLGIGSGKCGTTWLFNCLTQHPEICDMNPKEINYFSSLYEKKDSIWYKSQFRGCKNLLKGEFSVSYMEDPNSANRIRKCFPDIKLIAILRDPIRKVYSNYLHSIRKGEISSNLLFDDYIKKEENLLNGKYYDQLVPFYENFERSQIKIVILEIFKNNIKKNLPRLYKFIGVNNTDFIPTNVDEPHNVSKDYKILILEQVITNTSKFLNQKGHTLFIEKLKKIGIPSLIRKFNEKQNITMKEMNRNNKIFLKDYFKRHNDKLENLISKDLSVWIDYEL